MPRSAPFSGPPLGRFRRLAGTCCSVLYALVLAVSSPRLYLRRTRSNYCVLEPHSKVHRFQSEAMRLEKHFVSTPRALPNPPTYLCLVCGLFGCLSSFVICAAALLLLLYVVVDAEGVNIH